MMNKDLSETERFYKEQLVLALACWMMSDADEEGKWVKRMFNPRHEDPEFHAQLYCRFTLNAEGFAAGEYAPGELICAFSFDGSQLRNPDLTREEAIQMLYACVLDGILSFTPEMMEFTHDLAFEVRDEVLAFNQRAGQNVYKQLTSSDEVWKKELLPRTYVYLNDVNRLH